MMEIFSKVKGDTEVFTVIGSPIEHSFSPIIHNTMAEVLNRNFIYTAMEVEEDCLNGAIKGAYCLGIKGLNVTVPHKIAILDLLFYIEKSAKAIGAVNTLKYSKNGYIGYNTDAIGSAYAIENAGYDIKGKVVLLLGAGGAGNACAVMALEQGCKKLIIANRNVDKARRLKKNLLKFYDVEIEAIDIKEINSIERCDLVINCTILGFGKNENLSPIEDKNFFIEKKVQFVFDVIYAPWETKLLKDARSMGIECLNGFSMLVYQAIAAEEIWFDEKIDKEIQIEICEKLSEYFREKKNG